MHGVAWANLTFLPLVKGSSVLVSIRSLAVNVFGEGKLTAV